MDETAAAYLDSVAEFRRITIRSDGLVADMRHGVDALGRWQQSLAEAADDGVETALQQCLAGEAPNWREIRQTLVAWAAAARRVATLWDALPFEVRTDLEPPSVRLAEGAGEFEA